MALAKIVYASMTGNTEQAADLFEETLQASGMTVEKEQVDDSDADFYDDADLIVYATYTTGMGDTPEEAEDFLDDIEEKDFSGKPFVVIGSGDSEMHEDTFCFAAIDAAKIFEKTGAKELAPVYKINNAPEGEEKDGLIELAKEVAKKF
ncbi:flavodoxin domain-containing protein [Enterococcus hirae]|nr:flavodoxin domain-containing protein [Enterococcaceae bacterium]MCI1919983.1 flavodoxin domain-containing protein [Enterococcaceae bacterium]MDM8214374.1 flavodoxin domain-containing protein [Enterococcus hirae]